MPMYRKTALVEAEQFLPDEGRIPDGVYQNPCGEWTLDTLEGPHPLRNEDYVCIGHVGERWNVDKKIFEATYELVRMAEQAEGEA